VNTVISDSQEYSNVIVIDVPLYSYEITDFHFFSHFERAPIIARWVPVVKKKNFINDFNYLASLMSLIRMKNGV